MRASDALATATAAATATAGATAAAAAGALQPAGQNTRVLNAIAQAGMFLFGLSMALIGAFLPFLPERLSVSFAEVGAMFLVMNFAMLIASLVLGLVADRFGLKLPLVAGAWLVALALFLFGHATRVSHLLPAVAFLGFGGGLLNGGTNTLVADLYDDPRRKASALNLLGVFFGVGALFLPFAFGALTSRFGITGLLTATMLVCLVIGAATAILRFPAPKQGHGGWPLAQMPRFIRMPIVLLLGALLFFQSGNEFALGGYVGAFLTTELGAPRQTASYGFAGFWAAIMLSRMVLSRVVLLVSPTMVVVGCALGAAVGALIMAAATTVSVAVIGALITGFALGGVFPTVLGLASARFHEHSGTVFGILFTIALTGGMTVPWLSGQLADAAGLRWVLVLTAGNFVVVSLLALAARRAS